MKLASIKQNIIALIAGLVSFFILTSLKLPLWLVLVSTFGIFIAVFLLIEPRMKVGNLRLIQNELNEELSELYNEALEDFNDIKRLYTRIKSPDIKLSLESIMATGNNIFKVISNDKEALSPSRHFLEYYIPNTKKILGSYVEVMESSVDSTKLVKFKKDMASSMRMLDKVYKNQLEGYHKDDFMELEVQAKMLESTIKLGGELLDEKE
ncbi:MAG: 5-bromo-4-chloroindolyl phosphate hydrolysis family protein [Firmicutes bacterium]|nr:5-bromo-4-chloroindolyl phosphate hydrolysis family protein [Bacillota bacterium]